jgi:hypothetical protein
MSAKVQQLDLAIWHRRLGYRGEDNVRKLTGMSKGIDLKEGTLVGVCEPCLEGKWTRQPSTRATAPLELVLNDLCGRIEPTTIGGANYYLLFTDDYTRMSQIYPLNGKTSKGVLGKIKEYKAEVEN